MASLHQTAVSAAIFGRSRGLARICVDRERCSRYPAESGNIGNLSRKVRW